MRLIDAIDLIDVIDLIELQVAARRFAPDSSLTQLCRSSTVDFSTLSASTHLLGHAKILIYQVMFESPYPIGGYMQVQGRSVQDVHALLEKYKDKYKYKYKDTSTRFLLDCTICPPKSKDGSF